MSGRHSKNSHKSKMPIIITIISAVIVIAVIVIFVFFMNKPSSNNVPTQQTTVTTTTVVEETQAQQSSEAEAETTQEQTTKPESVTIPENTSQAQVVVPTKGGETIKYFNATFAPYKAIDTFTDTECSLKEVFGSSYSVGVITFNDNGSFRDSVSSSVGSGSYVVEGESIVATYSNDKNMNIRAIGWDGDTPTGVIINYGGYDVYFSM